MRTILLFIFCSLWITLEAQQLPLFSQYRENQAVLNPSILHADNVSYNYQNTIGLTYRNQWQSLSDGPNTITARYEHISEGYPFLFGGMIISDNAGPNKFNGVYGRYAYQAYFDGDTYLSIGAAIGALHYRFDPTAGVLVDSGDIVGSESVNKLTTDINIGIFYKQQLKGSDAFYIGGSLQRLAANNSSSATNGFAKANHYYLLAGAYIFLSNGTLKFVEPSIWFKQIEGIPPHLDFNIRVQLSDYFWIGTGITYYFDEDQKKIAVGNPLEVGITTSGGEDSDFLTKFGIAYNPGFRPYGGDFGSTLEFNLTFTFN